MSHSIPNSTRRWQLQNPKHNSCVCMCPGGTTPTDHSLQTAFQHLKTKSLDPLFIIFPKHPHYHPQSKSRGSKKRVIVFQRRKARSHFVYLTDPFFSECWIRERVALLDHRFQTSTRAPAIQVEHEISWSVAKSLLIESVTLQSGEHKSKRVQCHHITTWKHRPF